MTVLTHDGIVRKNVVTFVYADIHVRLISRQLSNQPLWGKILILYKYGLFKSIYLKKKDVFLNLHCTENMKVIFLN